MAHRILLLYLQSRIVFDYNKTLVSFFSQKMRPTGAFQLIPKTTKNKNSHPNPFPLWNSQNAPEARHFFPFILSLASAIQITSFFYRRQLISLKKTQKTQMTPNSLTLRWPKPHNNFLCLAHRLLILYLLSLIGSW